MRRWLVKHGFWLLVAHYSKPPPPVRPVGAMFSTKASGALLRLAVEAMGAAARAELFQLHPARVIALVLRAGVVALFALGAGERDQNAVLLLSHWTSPLEILDFGLT